MNKTVLLVNEWAAYEANHPDASIEEFCRYYLTAQRSKREVANPSFGGGAVPPNPRSHLMKLMAFLSRAAHNYMEKSFERISEIRQKEDFFILNIISNCGECRKTDVINQQLLGLSTGMDTLNRLLVNDLISERTDPTDKRARLIQATPKGREVLERCYTVAQKVNSIVLSEMTDDDIRLCIQLLRSAEAHTSAMMVEMRDKPLDEVYEQVVGERGKPVLGGTEVVSTS